MCKLKSAIILKDRIFMPDYDSHSDMLAELSIKDDYFGASKVFVRAELSPSDGDVFSDVEGWKLKVDQDITPEWFDKEESRKRMVQKVKEWANTHIFVGVDNLKLSTGSNYYIKDCKGVEISGSASVKYISDSASVENISGSASVKYISDSASVENISGSASVENISDSASVKYIYGSASVENIYGSASVKYIYGSASVEYISGSASVENIFGSASVENIFGSASVEYISDSASVKKAAGFACVSSSRFTKWKNSESLILTENATFRDCLNKVIYQAGGWKLVEVKEKTVDEKAD